MTGQTTNSPLRLALLGPVQLTLAGRPVVLPTRKALALLCYLSLQTEPVDRGRLAALLWGDWPEAAARRNLRVELRRLRSRLPDVIQATRTTLRFRHEQPHWLDVSLIQRARWESAPLDAARSLAALYRGEFLSDLVVADAPEFEQWLTVERERQRSQIDQLLAHLVDGFEEKKKFENALSFARRRIELAPWQEEGYRAVMQLQARLGRRAAGLKTFDLCRANLLTELGIHPGRETVALAAAIEKEELPGGHGPAAGIYQAQHNLPAAGTPFVGREAELAHLRDTLLNPGCRLLTLCGLGGVGKTRLALAAAWEQIGRFPDGIYWVPLSDWGAGTRSLALPLALALGLTFEPDRQVEPQLLALLRGRRILLLLDNCEHLLNQMTWLSEVLGGCPEITVLATSREPLHLHEEWIFQVDPLPFPQGENLGEGLDCISLFEARAVRADHAFQVGDHTMAIARICRLVYGLPLGIELAAGAVRRQTPSEIAAVLAADIDAFESWERNVPERQRSLQAAFGYSWRLLPEELRDPYLELTIFPGDFSPEAAAAVADLNGRELLAFVDKSLLEKGAGGRFVFHPLLQQLAYRLLDEQSLPRLHQALCLYLAGLISDQGVWFRQASEREVVDLLNREQASIQLMLDRFVKRPAELAESHSAAVGTVIDGWLHGQIIRGLAGEGARWLDRALASLRSVDQSFPAFDRLITTLRQGRATCYYYTAEAAAALPMLQQIQPEWEKTAQLPQLAENLLLQGFCLIRQGDYSEAKRLLGRAREIGEGLGNGALVADTLRGLATIALYEGELAAARRFDEETLIFCRDNGYARGLAITLSNLGTTLAHDGDHEAALAHYRQALAAARQLEDRRLQGMIMGNLGSSSRQAGRLTAAREYYRQSLRLTEELAEYRWIVVSQTGLAQTLLALGDLKGARRALAVSLSQAAERDLLPDALEALVAAGRLLAASGQFIQGVAVIYFVIRHEATAHNVRRQCRETVAELKAELPGVDFEAAQAQGQKLSLAAALELVEKFM